MKKIWGLMFLIVVLLLGACSDDKGQSTNQGRADDGEASNGYGAVDHGIDEKKVGFNIMGDTIEEATNIPAEEKEKVLETFNFYIKSFNEKDIDNYIEMLSADSESFDTEEERKYLTETFNEFDVNLQASDQTIVSYSEKEVQVFAKIKTTMKQLSTDLEVVEDGRHVILFVKEEDVWKLSSNHRVGDQKDN